MALFKAFRGTRASLATQELYDGHAYFCIDDGTFHIDYADANGIVKRKQINAKEAETLGLHPVEDFILKEDLHDGLTLGNDTVAGGKGFKIGLIYNDADNYGYQLKFNKYEDDFKNQEEAQEALIALQGLVGYPNYYSVVGKNAIYHAGNLAWVGGPYRLKDNNNEENWAIIVKVGNEDTLISGLNTKVDNEDNFERYNYLIIDRHPEVGNIEVGWNSFATGSENVAQNLNSFAAGKKTQAVGKNSTALGESTVAGHDAMAQGLRA
jgi:hypothetical protein